MKFKTARTKTQILALIVFFALTMALPLVASAGISLSGGGVVANPSSGPQVTFVLSINDDGTGHFAANDFAVYAVDSTADGNVGLVSFHMDISNATTFSPISTSGAVYGNYDDGTGTMTDKEIGFNILRKANSTSNPLTSNLVGAQDTIAGPAVFVYGFGQPGVGTGNLSSWKPSGSTGLDATSPLGHTTNQNYGVNVASATGVSTATAALLLDTGTYTTGSAPTFVLNVNTSATVWTDKNNVLTGGDTESATVTETAVTLTSSAPEPTSMMLLGLGAGGLILRRRRNRRALRI